MDNGSRISFYIDGCLFDFVAPFYLQLKGLINKIHPRTKEILQQVENVYGDIKYIVDVGANVGAWSVAFAHFYPEAEILAIEPSKYNYPYLLYNIKPYKQIKPIKLVISNDDKMYEIANPTTEQRETQRRDNKENTGLLSIYGKSDVFKESVKGTRLDNIIDRKVDWLKIDVEGAELDVLEGAQRIIKESRPIIQLEMRMDNIHLSGRTMDEIIVFLQGIKYKLIGEHEADWVCAPNEVVEIYRQRNR